MDHGDPLRLTPLQGRRLLLGVAGGIAAYKIAGLASTLVQAGADVTVAMSEAAMRFVTPLTFESITGRAVYTDIWGPLDRADPQHVRLVREIDLVLLAPCTMDLLGRLAGGLAGDPLTLLAAVVDRRRQPTLLAPSMNEVMWNQPAVQRNVEQLRRDGFVVVEPTEGWHACRTGGPGRLPEPEALVDAILEHLPAR
ncbi:MAG: flavoprotein [Phycisphaerales bacterium]|jgi:phosphopantothenoylcysteine synthetase/decarboxylase